MHFLMQACKVFHVSEPLLSTLLPSEPVQLSLPILCASGSCVVGLAADSTALLRAW